MDEIPGPGHKCKRPRISIILLPFVWFLSPLSPSLPHPWSLTFTQTKKRMQISKDLFMLFYLSSKGEMGSLSPRSSLNFGNIIVKLQTLLLNHLPLLHLPRSNPCRELNVVLLHFLVAQWFGWVGEGGVCESSFNPQTRNNRFSSLFADPAHWCGMDFGLHAEPDQHDPSWAADVHTSPPFHLCLPHGPLLHNPGCSDFHRLGCVSQAFMFPERQCIAGVAEICWLEEKKTCPGSTFLCSGVQGHPSLLTKASFDLYEAFLALLKSFLGKYSPSSASRTSWWRCLFCESFPNLLPFLFCALCLYRS